MRTPHRGAGAADLGGRDPAALAAAARAAMRRRDVRLVGDERFHFDPVPRVIDAAEWEPLAAGLAQRVRALDALVRRRLRRAPDRARRRGACARDRDDRHARARAARARAAAVGRRSRGSTSCARPTAASSCSRTTCARRAAWPTPWRRARRRVRLLEPAEPPRAARRRCRRCCAGASRPPPGATRRARPCSPTGPTTPPTGSTSWLAPGCSTCRWSSSTSSTRRRRRRRLPPHERRPPRARHRPAAGAGRARRRLGLVNAFGIGVGDDKLAHAYVEDMVRYYLGEEPLVPSVRTYDLGRPEVLEEALDRFERAGDQAARGYGGDGVVICPHAERDDVERTRRAVQAAPQRPHRPGAGPALVPPDGDRRPARAAPRRPAPVRVPGRRRRGRACCPAASRAWPSTRARWWSTRPRTAAPRTPGSSSASPPRRGAPRPRAGCCGSPGRGRTSTSASAGAGPARRGRARGRSGRRRPRPAGA